ncbi:hypothetical protein T484DRAFT_1766050 [Baffinella frigidus]|nr:hypothetical protein T484DRAFT_1766050 [Cryptophyta sp. CCMP2293]
MTALFLFIDTGHAFLFTHSVDQLDDSGGGRTLEWLPVVDLPAHVRIVISTLPDNEDFSCLSQLRESMRIQGKGSQGGVIAEVETISDPLKVLEHILKGQGRKITQEQMLAGQGRKITQEQMLAVCPLATPECLNACAPVM